MLAELRIWELMAATRHSEVWQLPTAVVVALIVRLAQVAAMAVVVVGLYLELAAQAHMVTMAEMVVCQQVVQVVVVAVQAAQAVVVVVVAVRLVLLEGRQARE